MNDLNWELPYSSLNSAYSDIDQMLISFLPFLSILVLVVISIPIACNMFGITDFLWKKFKNKRLSKGNRIPNGNDWFFAKIITANGKKMTQEDFLRNSGFEIKEGDSKKNEKRREMSFFLLILILIISLIILSYTESEKKSKVVNDNCKVSLIKNHDHGYSKSFYFLLSNTCNLSSALAENRFLLEEVLGNILSSKLYKQNCPRCSIDIYSDLEALEFDYKIMNWSSLGMDQCDYNKIRYDKKVQVLLEKNLVLSFDDFTGEEIEIYPCRLKGNCTVGDIPDVVKNICGL